MHGKNINEALNVRVTIKGILERAKELGKPITSEEVLEELKFSDDDDTYVWAATVAKLMLEQES